MKRIQVAAALLLFCFEASAVVDYRNANGPLGVIKAFQALHDGNINAFVDALGQKPSPVNESFNLQTSQGEVRMRLIHVAALTKNEQMLSLLLASNARVSATDSLGHNAAHYLSHAVPEISQYFGFDPTIDGWWASKMLIILAAAGVPLDAVDNAGRQPIHYAAAVGAKALLQTLIDLGAPINAVDKEEKSAIQIAASQLHLDTVDFLKARGASAEVHFTDYIVGTKNRALTFVRNHMVGVTIAAASILGLKFAPRLCNRLVARADSPRSPPIRPSAGPAGSAPSGSPKGNVSPERRPSPALPPKADGPARGSVAAAGGGGAVAAAAILPRALQPQAQAAQPLRPVALAADPAQEPAAQPVTRLRRLRDAIAAVNGARDRNVPQEVVAAINAANALMDEIKGTALDPAETEERRHLCAAIRGIKKKNMGNEIDTRADQILAKHDGKRR